MSVAIMKPKTSIHSEKIGEGNRMPMSSSASCLHSGGKFGKGSMPGLLAIVAMVAGLCSSPVFAQLSCSEVYATSPTGQIYLTQSNGVQSLVGTASGLGGGVNPFGVAAGGNQAYLARSGNTAGQSGIVSIVNTSNFTVAATSAAPTLMSNMGGFNAGAVNPVNGWFYLSGANVNAAEATSWHLYAYNPATPTAAPVRVAQITNVTGNNGDLTFDSLGNLYLLAGNASLNPRNHIYRVGQVPVVAGSTVLPATALAEVPGSASGNVGGIAFNAAGELVTSSQGNEIRRYNPLTGAQLGLVVTATAGAVSDLGSCASGNSITVAKNLPKGRFANSDQFTLSLSGGGLSAPRTATTTGAATGLQQTSYIGPLPVIDGASFSINETPSGGTNFANYRRSWQCLDSANSNTVLASGSTFPGTVTIPANAGMSGAGVVCIVTNTLPDSTNLTISKTNNTDTVPTGGVSNYQIVVNNTGPDAADNSVVVDPVAPGLSCVTNPTCSASGGAVCPSSLSIAALQGAGLTIPTFPSGAAVTLQLTCSVTATGTP